MSTATKKVQAKSTMQECKQAFLNTMKDCYLGDKVAGDIIDDMINGVKAIVKMEKNSIDAAKVDLEIARAKKSGIMPKAYKRLQSL